MRHWLAIIGLLIHTSDALAGDTLEMLPEWPPQRSRPVIARGPVGAPAPLVAPVSAKPINAEPRRADESVVQSTFRSQSKSELVLVGETTEVSPSDHVEAIESASPTPTAVQSPRTLTPPPATQEITPVTRQPATGAKRLLQPAKRATPEGAASSAARPPLFDTSWAEVSSESITTVGAALGVVIGLLLLVAWVWRRAAPRSTRQLPTDVISVIGRAPLANRQVAQLIKIGGKLVLVCVTPDGAKPLTEITDPEEVARLLGLCEQNNPHSASVAFREVFDQLIREPAAPGFLGGEEALVDRQKLADAYANTPGGRAYA
ncbi:MAG: flagellar biosynthetic protein FliO [Planctomycetota bacterium]